MGINAPEPMGLKGKIFNATHLRLGGIRANIELMSIQYRSPMQIQAPSVSWDKLGASLSFACALHCAFQPILLMALPFLGLGFLMNEQVETVFLALSVVLASWSIVAGIRHHGQRQALPILVLASLAILFSRFSEAYEPLLAIAGALGIVTAHLYNLHLHKRHHQH